MTSSPDGEAEAGGAEPAGPGSQSEPGPQSGSGSAFDPAGSGSAPDGDPVGAQPGPPRRQAKVVTVSDGVVAGTREDRSGEALHAALTDAGFEVVSRSAIADGVASVAGELARVCASFVGVVVTTGGTGFAPRDNTPEGTREIIQRDAPGLAEAMRLVHPLGRLSRGIAGISGHSIILNVPGSPTGAAQCLAAVIDILPHAVDLLSDAPTKHPDAD